MHVYIDRAGACVPPIASPSPATAAQAATGGRPHLTLIRILHAYRRTEDVQAKDAFTYCFWSLVKHSGATVRYVRDDLKNTVPPELTAAVLSASASAVASRHGYADSHGQGHGGTATHLMLPVSKTYISKEHWTAHAWDVHEPGFTTHRLTHPVACHEMKTPLTQRVAFINPDHMLDCGFTQPSMCDLQCSDDGEGTVAFPPWCLALDNEPRMRAWCRLVTQKASWGVGGVYARRRCSIPKDKPAVGKTATLFEPTCMAGVLQFCTDAVYYGAKAAARAFVDPTTTWRDTLQAAWVLADLETAFRHGLTVTPAALDVMPPSEHLADVMAQRVCRMTRYASWVGINVPMPGNSGVLDYLYMDHAGLYHALTVRVSGSVVANARVDLLKTQAALSSLATPCVATVRVLYVRQDESVGMDVSQWSPAALRRALTTTGVPPWPVQECVVYASCDAVGDPMYLFDPLVLETRTVTTMAELWAAVGTRRRLVSWNYTLFSDGDASYDNCVYDIAFALRVQLDRSHGDDALQVQYAHVVDVLDGRGWSLVMDSFSNAALASVRAERVRDLYIGFAASGLLVYAAPDSAQPEGVALRCVPSVAFMRQYFER